MLSANQSENLSQSLWRRTIIVVDQSRHKLTVGSELKVSLQTKDPREAKNRAKDVQGPFDMYWVKFRSKVVELTLDQVVGLAGEVCHRLVSFKDTLRYSSVFWDALRVRFAQIKAPPIYRNPLTIEEHWVDPLADSFSIYVDEVVDKHRLNVGRKTRRFLLEQEVKVYEETVELMDRRAQGDYRPHDNALRFPIVEPPVDPSARCKEVSSATFVDLIQLETRPRKSCVGAKFKPFPAATGQKYTFIASGVVAFRGAAQFWRFGTAGLGVIQIG